ncbi:hypothetical protein RRG08_047384 [Elysia crispata]|uniref:Uncharacterized protein n=1 Tax=Elysia crispata TaxID=231223 RepID=A0AAE0Y2C1_9GAST|nr:hypothetical protein RRG08_047384 [Elysia crispata]
MVEIGKSQGIDKAGVIGKSRGLHKAQVNGINRKESGPRQSPVNRRNGNEAVPRPFPLLVLRQAGTHYLPPSSVALREGWQNASKEYEEEAEEDKYEESEEGQEYEVDEEEEEYEGVENDEEVGHEEVECELDEEEEEFERRMRRRSVKRLQKMSMKRRRIVLTLGDVKTMAGSVPPPSGTRHSGRRVSQPFPAQTT